MKFWNWKQDETTDELLLNGAIDSESWYGDEVTPQMFRNELMAREGKHVKVVINSPGGDVFAASEIYTMLKEYGDVEVEIQSLAASAASVVAMAGNPVKISPTGMLMIHNPWTMVAGNTDDLKAEIRVLEQVKESIINAYELKTGLSRDEISRRMDREEWLDAYRAKELGFVDEILFVDGEENAQRGREWSNKADASPIYNKLVDEERLKDEVVKAEAKAEAEKQKRISDELEMMEMELNLLEV